MDFGQLFSLIFASLLGLLPILLLIGRRARMRGEEAAAQDATAGATTGSASPPAARDQGGRQPSRRTAQYDPDEASILSRIVRPDRTPNGPGNQRATTRAPLSRASADRVKPPLRTAGSIPARGGITARRIARLTPLQQAIVYRELLGPPLALRDSGGSDAIGS